MRRWIPSLFAVGVVAALIALSRHRFYPALPNPLTFDVRASDGATTNTEPLITTGRTGAADVLYLRRIDAESVVIGYDSWGHGGPVSPPFRLKPGQQCRLTVTMPALDQLRSFRRFEPNDRLRVSVDGRTILDAKVEHYSRAPAAIWIGENPLGGSSGSARFAGEITRNGSRWQGGADALFTSAERHEAWLHVCRVPLIVITALGMLAYVLASWVTRRGGALIHHVPAQVTAHRAFVITALVCVIAFAWVLTGGTFALNYPVGFGDFFDFQAASLLQGRIDVPLEGIGVEAFVVNGHYYGYFGITPSLLRLPFVALDVGFGNLSRAWMLIYYAGWLLAAYLVLLSATECLRGSGARPGATTTVLFLLNAGLGCTIFFLSSRAYIYHEAILCGATFALFCGWCVLQHLRFPGQRWWIGALACGVLAVHARPSSGLFALTFVGVAALWLAYRDRAAARHHITIAALAAVAVLSFNAVSYWKFGTFDGSPLQYQLQYQGKRLAHIEGKSFHAVNVPFNAATYLVRPNLELSRHFPWFSLGRSASAEMARDAKLDYVERTLALPYTSAPLFLFATLGCVMACVRQPSARQPAAIVWIAILPMALALFMAVSVAHRYTADFCPFLAIAAAFGFGACESLAPLSRRTIATVLVVVTAWTIVLTAALTLRYQGEIVWGVPDDVVNRYHRISAAADRFFGVTDQGANRLPATQR